MSDRSMRWDAITLIPIFASVLYGVIFTVVILSRPRTKLRQIFGVYLLAMFVWSISAFLTISGLIDVQPWFNIFSAAAITSILSLFYFVQTIFARRRKWAPYVFWYGMLVIAIILTPSLVFQDVFLDESGKLHYEFTPLIVLVAGPGYGLFIFSLIELFRGYKQTDNAIQRNRIRYLTIGLCITLLVSVVNFTELGKYPIDIAANGITAILIAYAILRHQLLDIRVVIRFGLLYSITTTILGASYYLVISLTLNLFHFLSGEEFYASGEIFMLSIFVAIITAVVLTPLRNQAQTWIDRVFYREKYNARLMLQRLSETTASLLDLDKIANMILSEVTKTLHIEHAAIYVKMSHKGDFHSMAQRGKNHKSTLGFRTDHPVVNWLSSQNRVLTKHNLNVVPTFKSLWGEEKDDLENYGAELFIPLNAKNELVGFIVVGPKLSAEPYSQDDQLTLTTLANQTAVAVENARLYEELEDTFEQLVISLSNAIDIRDTYTSDHSQHIADLAAETARKLGCSTEEIDAVYWGGLLHDIGKIGIPDSILNKPTKLSETEWDIIYQHTKKGAKIISPIRKLAHIAPIIEYSHERYDGSGYPYGVKGDEIPIGARIISVVDAFSAMIDKRPYKKAINIEEALEEIKNNSGTQFDPLVVDAFIHILKPYKA